MYTHTHGPIFHVRAWNDLTSIDFICCIDTNVISYSKIRIIPCTSFINSDSTLSFEDKTASQLIFQEIRFLSWSSFSAVGWEKAASMFAYSCWKFCTQTPLNCPFKIENRVSICRAGIYHWTFDHWLPVVRSRRKGHLRSQNVTREKTIKQRKGALNPTTVFFLLLSLSPHVIQKRKNTLNALWDDGGRGQCRKILSCQQVRSRSLSNAAASSFLGAL